MWPRWSSSRPVLDAVGAEFFRKTECSAPIIMRPNAPKCASMRPNAPQSAQVRRKALQLYRVHYASRNEGYHVTG
jgi:hypothetical protein